MSEYKELVAILTVMFFLYLMTRAIARSISGDKIGCRDKRVDELEKRLWELEKSLALCRDTGATRGWSEESTGQESQCRYPYGFERKDTAILSQVEIDIIVERFREGLKQTTHTRANSSGCADTGEEIDISIKS